MPIKANQIVLLTLSAIAVYLYWQKYESIYEDKGRLAIAQVGDAVEFSWESQIEVPMARRFEEGFAQWGDKTGKFIINLNSPGGSLTEGREVIELIAMMKSTHLIETHVGAGDYCLSMCVPIYLQGEQRVAARSSKWLFHEPRPFDLFSGEEVSEPEFERQRTSDKFFENYFVNSEMDETWRKALEHEWIGKDVWRTGQQLVDENSNIILKLY